MAAFFCLCFDIYKERNEENYRTNQKNNGKLFKDI